MASSFQTAEEPNTLDQDVKVSIIEAPIITTSGEVISYAMAPSISYSDLGQQGPTQISHTTSSTWPPILTQHHLPLRPAEVGDFRMVNGPMSAFQLHPDPPLTMDSELFYPATHLLDHNMQFAAQHIPAFRPSEVEEMNHYPSRSTMDLDPRDHWRSSPYPPDLMAYPPPAHTSTPSTAPTSPWTGDSGEEDYPEDIPSPPATAQDGEKPYAQWLYECLRDAPNHQMILQAIYQWAKDTIPKVQEALSQDPNTKGWQNSIRHNLSMNQGFVKVEIPGNGDGKKSTGWQLSEEALHKGYVESTTRYRKKHPKSSPKNARNGTQSGRVTKSRQSNRYMFRTRNGYRSTASTPRSSTTPVNSPHQTWVDSSCSPQMPPRFPPPDRLAPPMAPIPFMGYMQSPNLSPPSLSSSLDSPTFLLPRSIPRSTTPQTPPTFMDSHLYEPYLTNPMGYPMEIAPILGYNDHLRDDDLS